MQERGLDALWGAQRLEELRHLLKKFRAHVLHLVVPSLVRPQHFQLVPEPTLLPEIDPIHVLPLRIVLLWASATATLEREAELLPIRRRRRGMQRRETLSQAIGVCATPEVQCLLHNEGTSWTKLAHQPRLWHFQCSASCFSQAAQRLRLILENFLARAAAAGTTLDEGAPPVCIQHEITATFGRLLHFTADPLLQQLPPHFLARCQRCNPHHQPTVGTLPSPQCFAKPTDTSGMG
mmetsp:Transcript_41886/g.107941  ORF Transcript_41886/g.107941 Transcript_41886/m.107941 type:complete len:236 (+) Transcript_41886:490-1197(+)